MQSRFTFIGLLLLSCGALADGILRRFTRVVFFGDSQTDTGNIYRVTNQTWPIVPPYYRGRFTNGPNWVDQLHLRQKVNFAYGGATTDSDFVQGYTKDNTFKAPGVRQQIIQYQQKNSRETIGQYRTLHVVWAGANDFIYNNSVTPQMIANSLINCFKDLIAAGAKHLLMFNQPPAQLFPYVNQLGQDAFFAQLSNVGNAAIIAGLTELKQNNTDVSIDLFDLHTLVSDVVANKSTIRFENTVNKCWENFNLTAVTHLCSNPAQYVFIDKFHLTTRVHGLIVAGLEPFFQCGYSDGPPSSLIRSF